jgi:hypothetical protein
MPFALCNGVANAAALLLRCQVLHHPAKVDNNRAQLVAGGVPIGHARLQVRELLQQFLVATGFLRARRAVAYEVLGLSALSHRIGVGSDRRETAACAGAISTC